MISTETGSAPATDQRPHVSVPPPAQSEGVLNALSTVAASAGRLLNDFLTLATLEAKRAALSLMWMLGLGVAAALLGITAWLGLMGALACGVVALGVPWGLALVIVAVLNLVAAFMIIRKCTSMSTDLLFPATRRQIKAVTTRSEAT
jgi:Putative Actinobacterial Holin-X, holin superfamily III